MAEEHASTDPITTDPLSRDFPPTTPEEARVEQHNWFYESLAPEAKDRFLEALTAAQERGLGPEAAWEEAVVAAETTYPAATRPKNVAGEDVEGPRPDEGV